MKAPELPDKIYVRKYQNGYYTTWWDEKPHEEESIGMKAVCYIRKDALLEWAKEAHDSGPIKDSADKGDAWSIGYISGMADLIDKLSTL